MFIHVITLFFYMYVINNCKLVSLASNVGEENIRTNTYKFKETIISVKKKKKRIQITYP